MGLDSDIGESLIKSDLGKLLVAKWYLPIFIPYVATYGKPRWWDILSGFPVLGKSFRITHTWACWNTL